MILSLRAIPCAKKWRLPLRIEACLATAALLMGFGSFGTVCADPPGEPSLVRNSPVRVNDPNAFLPPSPSGNASPSLTIPTSSNSAPSNSAPSNSAPTYPNSTNPFVPNTAGNAAQSNVQPAAAWNSIPPRRDSGIDPSIRSVTTAAASRKSEQQPLELKGPGATEDPRVQAPRSPWAATLSMTLSLTVVVCLFLIAVFMLRKSQPKQFQKLPNEVIEVLGRSTMGPRQQLYVLRFGSKLILVSQQPGETQALGEITDQEESARLAGLCEANRPESISNSFKEVFRQVVTSSPKQPLSKPSRT